MSLLISKEPTQARTWCLSLPTRLSVNRAPLAGGQVQQGQRGPALLTLLSGPAELGPPSPLKPQAWLDRSAMSLCKDGL